MKALTLTQPWASLVAQGVKTVETRSWRTTYRGPIAIHAAKSWSTSDRAFAWKLGREKILEIGAVRYSELPFGKVIAIAKLAAIIPTEMAREMKALEQDLPFGDYSDDRFAWLLRDVVLLREPIAVRGSLGLWEWKGAELQQPAPSFDLHHHAESRDLLGDTEGITNGRSDQGAFAGR